MNAIKNDIKDILGTLLKFSVLIPVFYIFSIILEYIKFFKF